MNTPHPFSSSLTYISQPSIAGRPGRKWWRVRYRYAGEQKLRTKYLGQAQGPNPMNQTEINLAFAKFLSEIGVEFNDSDLPTVPTLKQHVNHYLEIQKPRLKPTTYGAIQTTCRYLLSCFGDDRRLNDISPTQAEQWFLSLRTGDFAQHVATYEGKPNLCKSDGLADGTIKPHLNNARQLFNNACKRFPDQVKSNPFAHIRIKVEPSRGAWHYVSLQDAIRAIRHCTDDKTSKIGWQVFIALCRFAGLRKSEALNLQKSDVDLTQNPPLIRVFNSKTARMSGKACRIVPVLYPILAKLLTEAKASNPGDPFIVSSQLPRRTGSEYKTIHRILKRADLPRWRPAFQLLRACCEIDFLKLGLSERQYTNAIGHSPEISRKYYLDKFQGAMLEDQDLEAFRAAASVAGGAK